MNTFIGRAGVALLTMLVAAAAAQAQSEKTREQVRAETREAMRLGLFPLDDVGRAPRDIYIGRYPPLASTAQDGALPGASHASDDAVKVGTRKAYPSDTARQ